MLSLLNVNTATMGEIFVNCARKKVNVLIVEENVIVVIDMTIEWKIMKVEDGKLKELTYSEMVDYVKKNEMRAIYEDLSNVRNQTDKVFQKHFGEGEIRADVSCPAAIRQLINTKVTFDVKDLMKDLLPIYEKDNGYKGVYASIFNVTRQLTADNVIRKLDRGKWENIANATKALNKEIASQ